MLIWGGAGLLLVAWLWWQIKRTKREQSASAQHLKSFLQSLGVPIVSVRSSGAYGWPGYALEFGSAAEQKAFSVSPHFEALIAEVGMMHGEERHGGQSFDPRLAVMLLPVEPSSK